MRALSFDPANGRLVSASYDRTVKVWDLKTGKMVREFRNGHVGHIFDVKFDVARIVRCVRCIYSLSLPRSSSPVHCLQHVSWSEDCCSWFLAGFGRGPTFHLIPFDEIDSARSGVDIGYVDVVLSLYPVLLSSLNGLVSFSFGVFWQKYISRSQNIMLSYNQIR